MSYEGYDLDSGAGGEFTFAIVGGDVDGLFRIDSASGSGVGSLYCDSGEMNKHRGTYALEIEVREAIYPSICTMYAF